MVVSVASPTINPTSLASCDGMTDVVPESGFTSHTIPVGFIDVENPRSIVGATVSVEGIDPAHDTGTPDPSGIPPISNPISPPISKDIVVSAHTTGVVAFSVISVTGDVVSTAGVVTAGVLDESSAGG